LEGFAAGGARPKLVDVALDELPSLQPTRLMRRSPHCRVPSRHETAAARRSRTNGTSAARVRNSTVYTDLTRGTVTQF
jgi:hypothetical protein